MIKINLLPEHLRPIKRTPLPYLLSGLALAVAVVVMAAQFLSTQHQISRAEGELAKHKQELATLQQVVDDANKLEAMKQQLADKVATINEIVRDRIIWSRVLWNLSRLAPENFWYSGISVEVKSFKERQPVIDPKTKETTYKEVMTQRPILRVSGYVVARADGTIDVYPLAVATEQDEEFSSMFKLESSEFKDTDMDGYPVRSFTLEFTIGRSKEAV